MFNYRNKKIKYLAGNKPFNRLTSEQRAVFILHLAGFTQREISKLKSTTSTKTVNKYIAMGYQEYNE